MLKKMKVDGTDISRAVPVDVRKNRPAIDGKE
jgi:hypothetical protein